MAFNDRVAEHFEELAQLMQLLDMDSFRVNAFARAGRTIADLTINLEDISADPSQLKKIDGIGAKIADKIAEFAKTGTSTEYKELAAKVPAGLLDILKISGFGPKTVRTFWLEGGVTDEATLRAFLDTEQAASLPRMGAKTIAKLKTALNFARASAQRVRLGQAMPIAQLIVSRMKELKGVDQSAFAGSLRRGRDTVGDIDILVTLKDDAAASAVSEAFRTMPEVQHVLATGDTKSSVQFSLKFDGQRWGEDSEPATPVGPAIQVDLKIVPKDSFGAAMHYFTGSKDHNIAMRSRALARGLTLNEYGLFPNDTDPVAPQHRGVKPVASKTEEDIFKALDLPYIPPEIREDKGELSVSMPELVTLTDIKAELHSHTKASDGVLTIEELASNAKARGFHTIAVTDHSQSSALAGGLKPERLIEHIAAIKAARKKVTSITILAGSEVDILADGSLDYDDELLAQLDVVVASPHAGLTQDSATATARLLKAIAHPKVNILGHPTGRLISRRQGLEPDIHALCAAAKKHNVALEINAHWMRLDLRDTHAKIALESGCLLAIDCDVHHPDDFENLKYGVQTARRAWATSANIVNCMTQSALQKWLAK